MTQSGSDISGKKIAAGICGILLGAFGIHKFVLGYTQEGIIMLLVTLLTCGFGGFVMGVIGLIEGIIYLTKSDSEFNAIYLTGKKGWF
jgi:TM2 domain-containing membrane protein YozV